MASVDVVLKESSIIAEGPPVRYRLAPKKENLDGQKGEESKLRRVTLGKKDHGKPNKTFLLVGETGSGKSTLINAILNYIMGVKMEDRKWFESVEDTRKYSDSGSATSAVTVYEFFGFEGKTVPFSLTIIDTPGYGDTRGLEYDAFTTQKLLDLFHSGKASKEIHAVGLVLKASENRLSDRVRYIFDSVASLFGVDMEKSIVALVTHSDGFPPENALRAVDDAKIKCARNEKNQPIHFTFNNCQNWPIAEDTEFAVERAWRASMRGMKKLTDFLEVARPQDLKMTVDVLRQRSRLGACINNLHDRISRFQVKKNEIQQIEEHIKMKEEEIKEVKKFQIEVDEVYIELEDVPGGRGWFGYAGVTRCTVCKENCHYPDCTWARSARWCEVMKDGRCTSCTSKCPVSVHVKDEKKFVTKTKKRTKSNNDLEQQFQLDHQSLKDNLSVLQSKEKEFDGEIRKLLDEAYHHVVTLEIISLNKASYSVVVCLEPLIRMMEERGDQVKANKLKEMNSRVDKGVLAVMRYAFGHVTAAGAKVQGKFPL